MTCKCGSDRLVTVSAKCSDACFFVYHNLDIEKDGYVPYDVGIGGGDYVDLTYCLNCGTIQGEFPITDEQVQEAFNG